MMISSQQVDGLKRAAALHLADVMPLSRFGHDQQVPRPRTCTDNRPDRSFLKLRTRLIAAFLFGPIKSYRFRSMILYQWWRLTHCRGGLARMHHRMCFRSESRSESLRGTHRAPGQSTANTSRTETQIVTTGAVSPDQVPGWLPVSSTSPIDTATDQTVRIVSPELAPRLSDRGGWQPPVPEIGFGDR